MATLFFESGSAQAPAWLGRRLASPRIDLVPNAPLPLRAATFVDHRDTPAIATFLCLGGAGAGERWALCLRHPGGVRLNGSPVFLAQTLLQHRDELVMPGGRRMFFSTERPPEVVPFPGAEQSVRCPRCRQEIVIGQRAICCPGCGTWSHQIAEELPCYTYEDSTTCPACPHSNDLGGTLAWTPEAL